MLPYHLLAVALAALLPTLLFVSGAVVRRQRSANFQDVMRNLFPNGRGRPLPQLALVGAKYDIASKDNRGDASPRMKRQPPALMLPAAIYGAITFIGFELLLVPISGLVDTVGLKLPGYAFPVREAFIWTTGGEGSAHLHNAVAVACMGFLGSYLANARFLVKQTMNMELNGMSFARAVLLMLMGVTIALVAYRTLSVGGANMADMIDGTAGATAPPAAPAASAPPAAPAVPAAKGAPAETPPAKVVPPEKAAPPPPPLAPKAAATVPAAPPAKAAASETERCGSERCPAPVGFWLGLGFLIGYAPESGLTFLMRRMRVHFQKGPPDDFFKRVASIPIEIVEGIDSDVAYRLEQNNIEDVQNLATANPLELYIETPYGFFECFDWVIQAQLCVVAGMEGFLELRRHGIRTIFDLERGVLPETAPPAYVLAIGAVLMRNASDEFRAHLGGPGAQITQAAVVHAVGVSLDDLHVHRLRTLWLRISEQIREKGDPTWLHRNAPVPGDRQFEDGAD